MRDSAHRGKGVYCDRQKNWLKKKKKSEQQQPGASHMTATGAPDTDTRLSRVTAVQEDSVNQTRDWAKDRIVGSSLSG